MIAVRLIKIVLGKTGREVGAGAGDQWVKPGDGNWEIDRNSLEMPSKFLRDLHTCFWIQVKPWLKPFR